MASVTESIAFSAIPPWGDHAQQNPNPQYHIPITNVSMTNAVNTGIEARWTMTGSPVQSWAEEATWWIRAVRTGSESNTWTEFRSPELIVGKVTGRKGIGGEITEFMAVDKQAFLSTSKGITLPTITDSTVANALTYIFAKARMSYYGDIPAYLSSTKMREFEVQGDEWGSYLVRIAKDYAVDMKWQWNRNNGMDTQIRFMDPASTTTYVQNDAALAARIWTADTSYDKDLSGRWHRIFLKKTSKTPSEYCFPLDKFGFFSGEISGGLIASTIQVTDRSQVGHAGYVAGWSQPNAGGQCGFFWGQSPYTTASLGLAVVGGLNIYSVTGSLDPPTLTTAQGTQANGLICLSGTPPGPVGYDTSFEVIYPPVPAGTAPEYLSRERKLVITSPLWQTQALADSLKVYIYQAANRNTYTVTREVRFDPFIPVGFWMDADTLLPAARYDAISWSWSGGAPTMQMHGWVPVS